MYVVSSLCPSFFFNLAATLHLLSTAHASISLTYFSQETVGQSSHNPTSTVGKQAAFVAAGMNAI